jgi:hypothetical protein
VELHDQTRPMKLLNLFFRPALVGNTSLPESIAFPRRTRFPRDRLA